MTNPATEFGLLMLRYNGQNLQNNTWKTKLVALLCFVLLGAMFVLGILAPIFDYQGVEALAKTCDVINNYLEYLSRLFACRYYLEPIKVVSGFEGFWPMDYCGSELKEKQLNIYNQVVRVFKTFTCLAVVLAAVSFMNPIFHNDRELPFLVFHTDKFLETPYYEILYCWQLANCYFLVTMVVGFDCLFIANLASGYCQMAMLKHKLSNLKIRSSDPNMNEKNYFNELKECVSQHNKILRYYSKVNELFSLVILTEFFASFANICMSLYLLANFGVGGVDVLTIRCTITIGANAWLLAMFCYAGSLVTSQYESISIALYDSEWYLGPSKSHRIRKGLLLIIQMAQKQLEIRVGGVFNMNMKTFATILRLSFSVYTFLKSVS